jgi:hypothetical protein
VRNDRIHESLGVIGELGVEVSSSFSLRLESHLERNTNPRRSETLCASDLPVSSPDALAASERLSEGTRKVPPMVQVSGASLRCLCLVLLDNLDPKTSLCNYLTRGDPRGDLFFGHDFLKMCCKDDLLTH